MNDFEADSVWCPTAANHSGNILRIHTIILACLSILIPGQPSDSAGGTFKRWILNECKAGHCKNIIYLMLVVFIIVLFLSKGCHYSRRVGQLF